MAGGYSALPNGDKVPTTLVGSLNEYKAVVWLIEQGYEVYKNVNPIGEVDLIAAKAGGGVVIEVDVKTLRKASSKRYNFLKKDYLTEDQIDRGIKPLFVFGDTVGWNKSYFPDPPPVEPGLQKD